MNNPTPSFDGNFLLEKMNKNTSTVDSNGSAEALASLIRLIADRAFHRVRHKTKVCFFLGAGADISSGGMTFSGFKRAAVEKYLGDNLFDITLSNDIDARFEELFRATAIEDRALLIETLFRGMEGICPSDSYKLLILLTEVGGVDSVVTTNFDLMLEQAQSDLGRDLFQIYAPGLARPYQIPSSRFEPPKKPYLKLHGDLGSRIVTVLTSSEIDCPDYDSSMLDLLKSILQTHDIVMVGYSGFDYALADIIANGLNGTENRIFWCNPYPPSLESPLYCRVAHCTKFINIDFDKLMVSISRPVLEKPSLTVIEPTYVNCLFDWRIDYCNREYINSYGRKGGKNVVDLFARRRAIEDNIGLFLKGSQPLAIISGPSGFGKTTIGIRLAKKFSDDNVTRVMLIRSKTLGNSGDIEQYICEQLGGHGSHAPTSIFKLEHWLSENQLRLVLFVDGINEYSPDLISCVQFFRNILRLCYFLPDVCSALRIVATIRQETWNQMLPYLDNAQLLKTVWRESDSLHTFNTIPCGVFSDEELKDALIRHSAGGGNYIVDQRMSTSFANQLKDPYLFGLVAEVVHDGMPSIPRVTVYQRAFEMKLNNCGIKIDKATIRDILASIAVKCLESKLERFREIDVLPASMRGEVIRAMKDVNIFVDASDGFLHFAHDRTFEYFLAVAFGANMRVTLETVEDLFQFLSQFKKQNIAIAAARLYFQLSSKTRFPVIASALKLLDVSESQYTASGREMLFNFAREVLGEMAEQEDIVILKYLRDAIEAARVGVIGNHHTRTVVQATANLSTKIAIELLTRVAAPQSSQAQVEAAIYATDKLVIQCLENDRNKISLLEDFPYSRFFGDVSINPWQRIGRLLGFSSQLGPDNTHPDEYCEVLQLLMTALDGLMLECPWSNLDVESLCKYIMENCDRLLFNSSASGINNFFENPSRYQFDEVLSRLSMGLTLTDEDVCVFEPYFRSIYFDVEYQLSHMMFLLSSINNLDETLSLVEKRFRTFSNKTSAIEVDFFQATLMYFSVLHNMEFDELRFGQWQEAILRDWPNVLLFNPGRERGERRGFSDPFDCIFEDGFGVIYTYGMLLPSIKRKRVFYKQYCEETDIEKTSQLPLYSNYLEFFLSRSQIEEALQILQALSCVIVLWPVAGLHALKNVIGHSEPRIRRATIRILSEAFARHPRETLDFIKNSGVTINEDDLIEIKIRHDSKIGRRQISEVAFARIGHFLMNRPNAKMKLIASLQLLINEKSLRAAIGKILQILGFLDVAGR